MLQHLREMLEPASNSNAPDLEQILLELTWDQEKQCYFGSQRAVARITGLAVSTISEGLALRGDRTAKRPKLLKWLAGEGISVSGIQREWSAGQVSDKHIAQLIVYAASEANSRTPQARHWLKLITGVGFRGAVHQMKGREDLLSRATARAKGLNPQKRACEKIQQEGKSFQRTRATLVKGVTTKVPQHLTNEAKQKGIKVKGNWRSHADEVTLVALSMTEEGFSVTGDENIGRDIRDLLINRGWDGQVHWSQERISCQDARDLGKLAKKS